MSIWGDTRRRTVFLLGAGVVLFFAVLGGLQAFNTTNVRFLNPESAGETLALTGLTVLVYLLLLLVLLLLLRNILKIYADPSSSALGARLRTRMVLGAVLIALTPAAFMYQFSFELMNRSLDRWFSPNTSELHEQSTRVVLELAQYVASNARSEAVSIAATSAMQEGPRALQPVFVAHRVTLEGGFVLVFDDNHQLLTSFEAPPESLKASLVPWEADKPVSGAAEPTVTLQGPLYQSLLAVAQRNDGSVVRINGHDYALGIAFGAKNRAVVAALPMPEGLSQTTIRIRESAAHYWKLFRERNNIRSTFLMLLLLITAVVFFSSVWMALFLSKQITRPVEALAEAMGRIATGEYEYRVSHVATGEMAELVESFNHMATDLEASRQLALSSSAQLTAANAAIEERRRELETIIETIPNGVVTLDAQGCVLQANRAFAVLLGHGEQSTLRGQKLVSLLPPECVDDVAAAIRRGQRMGAASVEIECHVHGHAMHLAITSARLELAHGQTGSVLVAEDTTELLRAQRQMAWKEVAQRVAHEIKNPLTPIALSAERIGRHLDRAQPDSPSVIRKCSEVILGCVGTMRTLVDQFSALAQFPAPQPHACDINKLAEEALAQFAGRLDGITVRRELEPNLPSVLADPTALRRALVNLIDNAAEAMQGSLLRVLTVSSALVEDGTAIEVVVADTGHGLTDEIRERLFLPFYSTKQRGTGLGLSIAAKIVQEHGGTIRAESNLPKGARFLVRVPAMEQPAADNAAQTPQRGGHS
ncbi:MAG: ATP-binding protein [Terracidiphilus sp.]|nr:ATP-binding protein [Terracidiphilus sp.]